MWQLVSNCWFGRLFILFGLVFVLGAWQSGTADEPVVDRPLPPAMAAQTMQVPPGFHVTLFAGEPDVCQPIAFCFDDRGRLWVAEAYNYPNHGTKPGDRIIILEDSDGDGQFDKRTVFYDQLNYVTGIEVGFGGVWVVSPPSLYFISDRDQDDRPDAAPQVLLDGFGTHANSHNLANNLAWGPDGWLYGTHGRTNWSLLGKPGTPDEERVRFDGGVYRYHPIRHIWEPYSDGSTNPWGIDWNDVGDAFVCNCVDPHLFHIIQGAHYEPWRNRKSSQFAYERIPSIADHLHFIGVANVRDGLGSSAEDEAGGGHAHCGTMVYLGDNWPEQYRNSVFMHNIHGKRINNDLLQRSGSGYTASHGKDIIRSRDPWYMGVTLRYGPDGSVYSSDWSDTGECHSLKNTRRETGRIFKISYGKPQHRPIDLQQLDDLELVRLQLHRNDWYVQHARRLLQERFAAGRDLGAARRELQRLFSTLADAPRQLRVMWALHATGGLDPPFLLEQLDHASEYIRAWSIRLQCENRSPSDDALGRFQRIAKEGNSQYERLWLASSLQRLSMVERWPLAEALLSRVEDSADHNLPLMVWYGVEPLIEIDLDRFIDLAGRTEWPLVRRHIARRGVEAPAWRNALDRLLNILAAEKSSTRIDVLSGILEGLAGRRSVESPSGWSATYSQLKHDGDKAVLDLARRLALIFDDPIALREVRALALDSSAPAVERNVAISLLVSKKGDDLASLLWKLVSDATTQRMAICALAECDDRSIGPQLIDLYPRLAVEARPDAIQTLASRATWSSDLLDAVEGGRIARGDLNAYAVRQMLTLKDRRLAQRVNALWGAARETSAQKTRLIAEYKKKLTATVIEQGDRSRGRTLFQQLCANCHQLFDAGGKIGPNITGAQRQSVEYLVENLIDPSGAVSREFQMYVIQTSGGRIVTGLIVAETAAAVTIQTANEQVVVPTKEIEERTLSDVSMMPDGLLQKLTFEQIRDLFAYLMGTEQAPLK